MKSTLRQSMAWLHTWSGLLTGWVLYFVFVTGTASYVNVELDRWMRPELPLASAAPPATSLVAAAQHFLEREATEAHEWYIQFPGGERHVVDLTVSWEGPPHDGEDHGDYFSIALNPETGEPAERNARETAGGGSLYYMHYTLHYLPYIWAVLIVGISSMFMLVAILSGIVTHKKIFKDFFTFRPSKGQRSWLDGHNLLSVTALPFHLMITWTGLVFYMFTYMPIAAGVLYPGKSDGDAVYEIVRGFDVRPEGPAGAAPLTPIAPLLAQAEQELGAGAIRFAVVENPGRANARINFSPYDIADHSGTTADAIRFDGVSGARLADLHATGTGQFNSLLFTLHEGLFAGPALRILFVLAGLAGTAMIGTGLVLWTSKRVAKLPTGAKPHLGMATVEVLNIGTIIGLPLGVAAYFWANRLIPVGLEHRGEWEIHAMFITWGLAFVYAVWRPQARAWLELTWLTSAAWALLPLLNALTTERHLGITVPAGDWTLAAMDLGMLSIGALFAFIAWTMTRKIPASAQPLQPELDDE